MSSQLHSEFILVQAVAHLLLPWFRVTSLSQSSFLELGYKWNSFCNRMFLPKRGWNSVHIHILLDELWKYSYTISEPLGGVQLCLFWNFEYTKAVIYKIWFSHLRHNAGLKMKPGKPGLWWAYIVLGCPLPKILIYSGSKDKWYC